MEAQLDVKIYYEDTDSLGLVYYANYLKYFERGRTELIAELGRPVQAWNEEGYIFAVFKVEVTFHKPARLGEICRVHTRVMPGSPYRMKMHQEFRRDDELLTEADIHLVCLGADFQLREFPAALAKLGKV